MNDVMPSPPDAVPGPTVDPASVVVAYARQEVRWSIFTIISSSLLACALVVFMPMRMAAYAHDALIQLEGAWRLEQGMRIHDGVHTPMGAFYPLLLQLGIRLFGPMPQAFLVPAILPLPFVAWGGWTILSPRFRPRAAALFTLFLVAILIGPTCLGDPHLFGQSWQRTTFGMQYNRVFWPFATLLAAACLIPTAAPISERVKRREAVLIGMLLALCFFGKVNFFIAGIPLVAIAAWHSPDRRAFLARAGAGFVGVAALFVLLGVPLLAYVGDISVLSRAQSILDRLSQIAYLCFMNMEYVAAVIAAAFAMGARRKAWLPIASLILLVYGIFVTSANYQERVIPPLVLALFVLYEHCRREPSTTREVRRIAGTVSSAIATSWIFMTLASFAPAYGHLTGQLKGEAQGITTDSYTPYLRATIVPSGSDAEPVVREMEKQAKACDRLFGRNARVFRIGWYNVLPVLRQAPSPSGLLWYHDGRTVSKSTLPPPERELKGVDGVVWPTYPEPTDMLVADSYRQYITQYFVPTDTDDSATYWRRR